MRLGPLALSLVCLAAALPAPAQEAVSPSREELVARERVRPEVERILKWLRDPGRTETDGATVFEEATTKLIALGPPVVPFMAAELDLPDPETFNIAAYVAGRVPAPGAAQALRKAIDAADEEGGSFAEGRKLWACYGLALLGDEGVFDLLPRPKAPVAWMEFSDEMRFIEVAALLTAPRSAARLASQIERESKEEALLPELDLTLRALGRIAGPSVAAAVPAILPLTHHARDRTRAAAMTALGGAGTPEALDALFAGLEDKNGAVRDEAALAIRRLAPGDRIPQILAALETQTDPWIRGHLYAAAAAAGGESVIEAFRSHFGNRDSTDRALLVAALGELGSRKTLNLLRASLQDQDVNVAIQATRALAAVGGEGAFDTLIALVNDPRWPIAETAVDALGDLRVARAGPRIAGRLLGSELAEPIVRVELRTNVEKLGDALVALRYTEALPDLAKAAEAQTEPGVVERLNRTLKLLRACAAHRDDVAAWSAAARDADPEIRTLAVERLGEIGGAAAATALLKRFDEVQDPDEASRVLTALATSRAASAGPLFEKILASSAYDLPRYTPVRDAAAWGARRLGGDRMVSALRKAAERRDGQDFPALAYLAVLEGKPAAATLRAMRAVRLRHVTWRSGPEDVRLLAIARALDAGRPLAAWDRTPDALRER